MRTALGVLPVRLGLFIRARDPLGNKAFVQRPARPLRIEILNVKTVFRKLLGDKANGFVAYILVNAVRRNALRNLVTTRIKNLRPAFVYELLLVAGFTLELLPQPVAGRKWLAGRVLVHSPCSVWRWENLSYLFRDYILRVCIAPKLNLRHEVFKLLFKPLVLLKPVWEHMIINFVKFVQLPCKIAIVLG